MQAQIDEIMKPLKEYSIPFIGLKEGKHLFEYNINNTFFKNLEYEDFNQADVKVTIQLNKKTTLLELDFDIEGTVGVNCDITNEPYQQQLENQLNLVVKFGEAYKDENLDILIIPHAEHQVNVQQYIYELIILAVPTKRLHPGLEDGTLQSDILHKLEELEPKDKKNKPNETDPRWEELKKLLTDK